MNFTQVLGHTWVLEGSGLMPVYRLDDGRCILLDTGFAHEAEEIDATLSAHNLTPVGIISSHAHIDHSGSNRYFQEKYAVSIAMTAPEAGLCSDILNIKTYRALMPAREVEETIGYMVHTPDVIIGNADTEVTVAGVTFGVIHTIGHSAGHICIVTPDRVCYAADTLMSQALMGAKLPYAFDMSAYLVTREVLRDLDCPLFVLSHKAVCEKAEIAPLLDANTALIRRRAAEISSVVTHPMEVGEICRLVCKKFNLHANDARKALYYERNIRLFLEFLLDEGSLVLSVQDCVAVFEQKKV